VEKDLDRIPDKRLAHHELARLNRVNSTWAISILGQRSETWKICLESMVKSKMCTSHKNKGPAQVEDLPLSLFMMTGMQMTLLMAWTNEKSMVDPCVSTKHEQGHQWVTTEALEDVVAIGSNHRKA